MKRHSTCRGIPVLLAAVLLSACRAAPTPAPTVEPPPVVEEVTKIVPIAGVVEPENIRLQLIQERAGRVSNEEMRRSFLGNVAAHQEIMRTWAGRGSMTG